VEQDQQRPKRGAEVGAVAVVAAVVVSI